MKNMRSANRLKSKSPLVQQLRGIAILIVVLYHLGVQSFSLGYLGVDMFFVISGYVMMQSCYRKAESSDFSVTRFLVQRSIRLVPALALMIFTVLMISYFFLPFEMGRNVSWTAFFGFAQLSNLYFYRTSGNYFSPDAQLNPYLHLWSLSMEFQFYFILSVFFYIVIRYKKSDKLVLNSLWFVFFLSIFISLRPLSGEPFFGYTYMTGFYGLPSRIWQFASGAIVYLLKQMKRHSYPETSMLKLSSFFIVFLSLAPITNLPQTLTRFLMVCGTTLLLWSDRPRATTPSSQFAFPIAKSFEKMGDLSYSVYLWHFPAITLGKLLFPFENHAPYFAFILSLPISILSHKFIEIRFQEYFAVEKIKASQVILFIPIFALITFLISLLLSRSDPTQELSYRYERPEDHPAMSNGCIDKPLDILSCRFTTGSTENQGLILVLGDSQAYAAATGVIEAARDFDLDVIVYASSGCPFFAQTPEFTADTKCSSYRTTAFEFLEKASPQIVYIANRTTGYLTRDWNWNLVEDVDSDLSTTDNRSAQKVWLENLDKTVNRLSSLGIKILVQQNIPDENRRSFIGLDKTLYGLEFPFRVAGNASVNFANIESVMGFAKSGREIEFELKRKHIESLFLVDPIEILCHNYSCPLYSGKQSIYLDWGHLSPTGSLLLVSKIKESISEALGFKPLIDNQK